MEEAVQQTLIAVYRHVGTFQRASKFTTWLFTIVRNECTRLWRARRRVRPVAVEDADRVDVDLDDLDRLEIIELLVGAIQRLPDRLRPTYVLRDVEGLTTAETAEALGLTTSNVKVQLHRAREQLRRDLDAELGPGHGSPERSG